MSIPMSTGAARLLHDGVTGPISVLSPTDAGVLLDLCARSLVQVSPTYGIATPRDRHLEWPAILEACCTPQVLDLVAARLGPNVLLWRSKFLIKEPGGDALPWHRDGCFPGYKDQPALDQPVGVSAWIALHPVEPEHGAMEFALGSHRVEAGDPPTRWGVDHVPEDHATLTFPLATGEAVVFDAKVLHRSRANVQSLPRVGLSVRYTAPSVRVYGHGEVDGQGHAVAAHRCVLVRGHDTYGKNRVTHRTPPSTTE